MHTLSLHDALPISYVPSRSTWKSELRNDPVAQQLACFKRVRLSEGALLRYGSNNLLGALSSAAGTVASAAGTARSCAGTEGKAGHSGSSDEDDDFGNLIHIQGRIN